MFKVNSIIDKSETSNPVLRITVGKEDSDYCDQQYSMSLKPVDTDMHGWCQAVMTDHFIELASQIENQTKKHIKTQMLDVCAILGINLDK